MKYESNECCDCAVPGYPCLGDSCSLRHVPRYRCDTCGADDLSEDDIKEVDGQHLCLECYEKEYGETCRNCAHFSEKPLAKYPHLHLCKLSTNEYVSPDSTCDDWEEK